ncbi:MAG: APC family permease [bacterium]|nr:APC family permease [bacterium]
MKKLIAATSTPLASIFGSGFLIIVPVLNGAVGKYAVFAMATVCGLAYCVGHSIRFNIKNAETLLNSGKASKATELLERSSDLALVAAYVISVCLYINILAAFFLGGLGEQYDTTFNEHAVSVAVIFTIGLVGYIKGLKILERLEDIGLWVTLLIVGALFVGFGAFDIHAATNGIIWPDKPNHSWWEILTIVSGTLIVVQGFETSRYLGGEYDQQTRISSCRWSQIISTVVYLLFVALATPMGHFLGDTVKDNDLIMLAGEASFLLPIPLVCAAVLSQFSAAVADTMGGSGNMVDATQNRVDSRHAIVIICGGAIILAFFPTLTILALASRAFAFFYMLQCLISITVAKNTLQKVFFAALAAILAFITISAVPAG